MDIMIRTRERKKTLWFFVLINRQNLRLETIQNDRQLLNILLLHQKGHFCAIETHIRPALQRLNFLADVCCHWCSETMNFWDDYTGWQNIGSDLVITREPMMGIVKKIQILSPALVEGSLNLPLEVHELRDGKMLTEGAGHQHRIVHD